jgi:dTDP-4-amino-4,6-dideoxygalactose transaminase
VTVPFLDLRRGLAAERDEIERAISGVLESGRFVGGEAVERFEHEFAAYCGAAHAVGVASGTDAIALALQAVGVGPGDEVLAPANTCVPTIAGIESAGARPVLVDVDPDTRTLAPDELEAAVGPSTRAIVPVHLYGLCADMAPIVDFARARGLKVVEDAAQAHGAEYAGRRAGRLGDAAAFSFYPTKNLGALGDAGAVVTDDADVAENVRMGREYGERRRYESVLPGRNSRLDALQAAVLAARLPRLDDWNRRRRELAALYGEALAGLELGLPAVPPDSMHVFHLYVVRHPDRAGLQEALLDRGVETLVHYPRPVHRHPAYALLAREGRLETSERLAREVLSLPLYPELTEGEVEQVAGAVRESLHLLAAA